MTEIGDRQLGYRATRDCPSCKKPTNSNILITANWVRVECRECTLIRDIPRIRTVVRDPLNGDD